MLGLRRGAMDAFRSYTCEMMGATAGSPLLSWMNEHLSANLQAACACKKKSACVIMIVFVDVVGDGVHWHRWHCERWQRSRWQSTCNHCISIRGCSLGRPRTASPHGVCTCTHASAGATPAALHAARWRWLCARPAWCSLVQPRRRRSRVRRTRACAPRQRQAARPTARANCRGH